MLSIKKTAILALGILVSGSVMIQSCNKLPGDLPIPAPTPSANPTIGDYINSNANYTILKAAVAKAGLGSILTNANNKLTVFAADDAAFIASGIPAVAIGALRAGQLDTLLRYHIIPQSLPSAQIPETFPNVQMPSLFKLQQPFIQLPIFPSRRGTNLWANNIPVTQADIPVANGVMHRVARVINPPSLVLAQILYPDTTLSFLVAAVQRADSGQVGLNRFDSLLKYPLVNATVFAPTNDAFRAIGITSPAVFSAMPVLTVRGIIAYHLLLSRAFYVNFPTTTTPIVTALGGSPYPPLVIDWTTGSLKLKAAGFFPGEFSNITTPDKHAINGVAHIIDRVLRPQ